MPEVLFVCVHNAGRSQMAAGFLRRLAGDRAAVHSAGSKPADRVDPAVVEVMAERGVDLSGAAPAELSADRVAAADVVVAMGCGGGCPVIPGKRRWTGSWTTPPARTRPASGRSGTRSKDWCGGCSPT